MKNFATILPCYAADTAGVCSALYELGGMTVVHDASGCNSTYATHDEPRWVEQPANIYISALTEMDAIMGNDEKLLADITAAAADRQPAFLALCGSPMPMMIGTDFDALARELETRTGLRCFGLHTNGMHSYLAGASEAMLAIAAAYVKPCEKVAGIGVNILGATPLDFGLNGMMEHVREWLETNGFTPVSCFAMGNALAQLEMAAAAHVNLVVSCAGLAAADYLQRTYGMPYVCGVPVGAMFSERLAVALRIAADTGKTTHPCTFRSDAAPRGMVIGEGIYGGSVAAALTAMGIPTTLLCPLDAAPELLGGGDIAAEPEAELRMILAQRQPEFVVADPLYRYILPANTKLIPQPHYAFSGRCFDKAIPDWTGERLDADMRGNGL